VGRHLRDAIIAGINRVLRITDQMGEANLVFVGTPLPVPDNRNYSPIGTRNQWVAGS
jgi:hypothetical protein